MCAGNAADARTVLSPVLSSESRQRGQQSRLVKFSPGGVAVDLSVAPELQAPRQRILITNRRIVDGSVPRSATTRARGAPGVRKRSVVPADVPALGRRAVVLRAPAIDVGWRTENVRPCVEDLTPRVRHVA